MVEPGRWVELAGIEARPRWSRRLVALSLVAVTVVGVLSWRLADLQVLQGAKFNSMAEVNRVHRIPVVAERGVIFDRHGRQLVVNEPAWSLEVTPVALPADKAHAATEVRTLAGLAGLTETELRSRLQLDPDRYRPLSIRQGLTNRDAETVQERLPELPGVSLKQVPIRRYLAPDLYGHLLGYTGRIDGDQYRTLRDRGYLSDESIGKSGLEAGLEDILRGTNGWQDVETDANGQVARVLRSQAAIPGRSVYLTIDDNLQRAVAAALREGLNKAGAKAGASVSVDPRDGAVLAMVSFPGYDDNAFARGISQADYDALLKDPAHPLFDRAIAGEYPPGSTFKMITGSAALQEGKLSVSQLLPCPANLHFGTWVYWNWAHYDMGLMNVLKAIPASCDTFFYEVANRLGPDTLASYAKAFGYGARTGVELPGQSAGVAPGADYKPTVCPYPPGTPDCNWNVGDTVTMGIGQSYLLATPLIQAMYAATLANGGTLLRPTLVHQVSDGAGKILSTSKAQVVRKVPVSAQNLEVMRSGMHDSLNGSWGTAAIARSLGFNWTGGCKTGTAQFGGSGVDLPSHAWFIDFAPYDNPEFASATILEGAGFGEFVAEPVAVNFLNYYHQHQAEIRG